MQHFHPILKFFLITVLLVAGLAFGLCVFLFVFFHFDHTLTTYTLPGGHTLRIVQDREFDIADNVFCELDGPDVRGRDYVAAIGAGTSAPQFTLHSATNRQIYWITAHTLPQTILCIVDLESRSLWPGFDDRQGESGSEKGSRLLALVNSQEAGYHLQNHGKWIGIER